MKAFAAGLLVLLLAPAVPAQQYEPGEEGTFSIIGRDPNTGQLGIAVHSKTIAVGARTRGGKGGVAVFAHQSASNPMYSTLGIELLEAGMTPQQALDMMLRSDEGRNSRQVAILDAQGNVIAAPTRFLGHFVVGQLASETGVRVELRPSPVTGITARVTLPESLLVRPMVVEAPPATVVADSNQSRLPPSRPALPQPAW